MKKLMMMTAAVAAGVWLSGCTVVKAPGLLVGSLGLNSEQVVQGMNVTRGTNGVYEAIVDSTSGKQSTEGLIQGLIALGALARGMQPQAAAGAAAAACVDGNCE